MAAVGIGGELLHVADWPEPAFRCRASRFRTYGRVHVLLVVGRHREGAGVAMHGRMPDTARGGDFGGGRAGDAQERGLDSCDAVDEQRIPRPVNRRQEPAGGEAQRTRSGPSSSTPASEQLVLAKISDWRCWGVAAARESAGWVRIRNYGGRLRGRGMCGRRGERPVSGGVKFLQPDPENVLGLLLRFSFLKPTFSA
jgi:hypothetical protein